MTRGSRASNSSATPAPRPAIACATPITPGMEIYTNTPNVKAMRVSTAVSGEYATFTCRVKWSLAPATPPTYRPILFSPSA